MIFAFVCHLPRFDRLFGIARTEHLYAGNRTERSERFDRLVRRSVFADVNRIVRKNVYDRLLHKRYDAQRRTEVIAEHEEGRTERAKTSVQTDTCADRRHRKLADAEFDHAPFSIFGRINSVQVVDLRFIRPCQIRRTADEISVTLCDHDDRFAARIARCKGISDFE